MDHFSMLTLIVLASYFMLTCYGFDDLTNFTSLLSISKVWIPMLHYCEPIGSQWSKEAT